MPSRKPFFNPNLICGMNTVSPDTVTPWQTTPLVNIAFKYRCEKRQIAVLRIPEGRLRQPSRRHPFQSLTTYTMEGNGFELPDCRGESGRPLQVGLYQTAGPIGSAFYQTLEWQPNVVMLIGGIEQLVECSHSSPVPEKKQRTLRSHYIPELRKILASLSSHLNQRLPQKGRGARAIRVGRFSSGVVAEARRPGFGLPNSFVRALKPALYDPDVVQQLEPGHRAIHGAATRWLDRSPSSRGSITHSIRLQWDRRLFRAVTVLWSSDVF